MRWRAWIAGVGLSAAALACGASPRSSVVAATSSRATAPETDRDPIVQVSMRGKLACARSENGRVWCWTYPSRQLAADCGPIGECQARVLPGPASTPSLAMRLHGAVELGVGMIAVVRLGDGTLRFWNPDGDERNASQVHATTWRAIETFERVFVGAGGMCGQTAAGALSCWGAIVGDESPEIGQYADASRPWAPPLHSARDVAISDYVAFAVDREGRTWAFGNAALFSTPRGESGARDRGPHVLEGVPPATRVVSAGLGAQVCVLTEDRRVHCVQELGRAMRVNEALAEYDDFVDLAVVREAGCAVRETGRLVCWGLNLFGALGLAADAEVHAPFEVPWLHDVRQVAMGGFATCVVRDEGRVTCFGGPHAEPTDPLPLRNDSGQVGNP